MIGRLRNFLAQETDHWFPYEKQIHELILRDPVFENITEVLAAQIASLHAAHRGFRGNGASATFSYNPAIPTWMSGDRELMTEISATNATGHVYAGSGCLASIEITSSSRLGSARKFLLQSPILRGQVPQEIEQ